MQIYSPTIMCNLAHGLGYENRGQRFVGSNSRGNRIFYCLQL